MQTPRRLRSLLLAILLVITLAGARSAFAQPPSQDDSAKAESATKEDKADEQPKETKSEKLQDDGSSSTDEKEGSGEEKDKKEEAKPLIANNAVICGILIAMLGAIFWTASSNIQIFRAFYHFVPMLLLCYFLPSLLTLGGVVTHKSSEPLYHVASRYLLPTCLVLLTISIDLREIVKLGSKAIIMFLTGTIGVILGGPFAVLIVGSISPETVGGSGQEAMWRGLSTVAGSWIGGGANQAAMLEVFEPTKELYGVMVAVDVIVAEIWMIFLLLGVGKASQIDRILKADASAIEELKGKMEKFSLQTAKIPTTTDLMVILAVGFGITGACHLLADQIAPAIAKKAPYLNSFSLNKEFFWLIVLATTFGIALSFTRARQLEGAGASKIGTLCIYFLVATIGMRMDLTALLDHPGAFVIGGVWMLIHVILLIVVAYFIRAPYFFLAVGSKANIGGAASAPVVAGAFHPSLAPVGVLLAVLGYALGTYGAWLCAIMMQAVSR